jgi:antitoxin component YwqK of YwqJK toxin-antitoxin module
MKFLLLPAFFICSFSLNAQYYYNDIMGTLETNRMMQTYLANKVKTVSVDGYNERGMKTTDFSETQEVRENGKVLKIVTTTNLNRVANYKRFDDKGRLSSVTDTSMGIANTSTYEYDNTGRLVLLQNSVKDPENEIDQVETHQWIYNKEGKPEKMWRIVNKTDSLEVRFIPDENGDPGEEIMYKRGKETDHVYYYYDDEGRISDIVRFDEKVKKLVPDNIITYDDSGRVIQVVTNNIKDNVGIGRLGKAYFVRYMIWRFVYNENGLKTNDVLFNANQEITGKIKYNYTFGQ